MFASAEFSRTLQRVVCMMLSAAIVITSLFAGAYASTQATAAASGYSVTITQLQ